MRERKIVLRCYKSILQARPCRARSAVPVEYRLGPGQHMEEHALVLLILVFMYLIYHFGYHYFP